MASRPVVYVPRRRSLVGPAVLILIGLAFLLKNFGFALPLFPFFARWWPLLLILVGLVRLAEYFYAEHQGSQISRMGGGSIFLLVILCLAGLGMTTAYRHRGQVDWEALGIQIDPDLANIFGTAHSFENDVTQALPANASLKIISDRGNVTVNTWDQDDLKVMAHKRVFSSSDDGAAHKDEQTKPVITVNGSIVLLNANTQGSGSGGVETDMEIFVPRKVAVEVTSRRGDVNITTRTGDAKITTHHGDVSIEDLQGNIVTSIEGGSLHASRIQGNVNMDGRATDVVLMDITGTITLNGDVMGNLQLTQTKNVKFNSSRTNLELARIDGDLSMDKDDLHASNVTGPVLLTTRAKDINFLGLAGDLKINDDNGDVEIDLAENAQVGNIQLATQHGDIELKVPAKATFQATGSTRHGDISSDFDSLNVNSPEHGASSLAGSVGKSGGRVQITSNSGDIAIRKK